MSGSLSHDDDRKLFKELQQLVCLLGIDSGRLTMVMHEGSIPHLVIEQRLQIPRGIDLQKDFRLNELELPPEESIIASAAQCFVRTHLEPVVSSQLGPFCQVVIDVKEGMIEKGDMTRKLKKN